MYSKQRPFLLYDYIRTFTRERLRSAGDLVCAQHVEQTERALGAVELHAVSQLQRQSLRHQHRLRLVQRQRQPCARLPCTHTLALPHYLVWSTPRDSTHYIAVYPIQNVRDGYRRDTRLCYKETLALHDRRRSQHILRVDRVVHHQ